MTRLILAAAVLALTACGGSEPAAESGDNGASAADVTVLPPDESPALPVEANAPAGGVADTIIPAALQGRWGLSPADCEPGRSDAKGLLTVSGDDLRFYESVARPSPGAQTSDNSVSGNFAFTGEGMYWTKYQTLELQDGRLVRTESDPIETSYTYVRC